MPINSGETQLSSRWEWRMISDEGLISPKEWEMERCKLK